MANTPSADKRNRQNERRRERNRAARSRLRTAVRKLRGVVAGGDQQAAAELLGPAVSLLDSTARKGIIHPNAAARTKSRLTRSVAKLG